MDEQTFISNVEAYCKMDAMCKELQKQRDALRESICTYMSDNKLNKQAVDGFSLSMSVSQKTTVDNEKLLSIVKGWGDVSKEVIRTKEYVDENLLENAVYNGEVEDDQLQELDACRTVKEVTTLRVYPVKAKGVK